MKDQKLNLSRRIKRIEINAQFFEAFFLGMEVHLKIKNPLPTDARIVQIGYDINTNNIVIFIESACFPEVQLFQTVENYLLEVERI
jgi:hypothetical protein